MSRISADALWLYKKYFTICIGVTIKLHKCFAKVGRHRNSVDLSLNQNNPPSLAVAKRSVLNKVIWPFVPYGLAHDPKLVKWGSTWARLCGSHIHDDVIKWKHFPRYWPFVRGIHRSPVNSPHKSQWRGALMFSLICPNKQLSKQSWGWWFGTPSWSLWRQCNALNPLDRFIPFEVIWNGIDL